MSKILVTGSNGFIGKSLVNHLRLNGYDVLALSSERGDIGQASTLRQYEGQDITTVFHLAGKTFVPNSWEDITPFMGTNVMGTTNVLEFCVKNSASLIFVSGYVYGNKIPQPISEDTIADPNNPYALTKCLAENICEFYARHRRVKVVVIRPFNVFGRFQDGRFLIPSLVKQAIHSSTITVRDLSPRRDYIYVDDVVAALVAAANKKLSSFTIFNIGTGHSVSVKEVIDLVQSIAGTNNSIVCSDEKRENEMNDVVADISKAVRLLDWAPKTSLEAGLKILIDFEKGEVNGQ